jgi:hypothetical protein
MASRSRANPRSPLQTVPGLSACCVTAHGLPWRMIALNNCQTATYPIAYRNLSSLSRCQRSLVRSILGQTHVVLPPVEFLRRLAALICAAAISHHQLPRSVRTQRETAPARLCPGAKSCCRRQHPRTASDPAKDPHDNPDSPHWRRTRMLWSQLLRRIFAVQMPSITSCAPSPSQPSHHHLF